jgi:serine-type D-Ala-D-Ala endopeptidase (penicillin-binding protein 7)
MPKAKKQKQQQLSRRTRTLATLGFLSVGGLLVGCVAFAYTFIAYPSYQARRVPAVAGAIVAPWEKPVLQPNAPAAPSLRAQSGILYDVASAEILWANRADDVRPLASLTKLVTVGAYLQRNPDLDQQFTIPARFDSAGISDMVEPGVSVSTVRIPTSTRLPYRSLVVAALVSSANNAALALGNAILAPDPDALQRYATAQGASSTRIVEASGLDPANVGSAHDVALLAHALFRNPFVQSITSVPVAELPTSGRTLHVRSTDALIGRSGYHVDAGKTGYLVEAGYNFAVQATQDGRTLLLVLLGEPSTDARFADADAMLRWAFSAYTWVPQF